MIYDLKNWKELQLGLCHLIGGDSNSAKKGTLMAHPNSIHNETSNHTLCWMLDKTTNKLEDLEWLKSFNPIKETYVRRNFNNDGISPPTDDEASRFIDNYWKELPPGIKGDGYTYDQLVSHAHICKAWLLYYGFPTAYLEFAIQSHNSHWVKKLITIPRSNDKLEISGPEPFWYHYWEFYPNDKDYYYRAHSNKR